MEQEERAFMNGIMRPRARGTQMVLTLILALGFPLVRTGLANARPSTDRQALQRIADESHARFLAQRGPTWERLSALTTGPYGKLNANPEVALIGVDSDGREIWYGTDNADAARTIRTNTLYPGGISGYDLTGANGFGMAIWDGGTVRATHVEFGGRVFLQDNTSYADHATHVAGTMMAAGVNAQAKGMSPESYIFSYDWDDDNSEMATAAPNLWVSNHSYSRITGWRWNGSDGAWYWYGDPNISEEEDYGFGFYGTTAAAWDGIVYNAPYYVICKSGGNDRSDSGPSAGQSFYINFGSGWQYVSTPHPPGDGGSDGYDTIAWYSTAKNVITVGAVNDLPASGYTGPGSVSMSGFSSFGPVDDGRIKPDVVANGVGLLSSVSSSDNSYDTYSGTSMATPNLAGTINLLDMFYQETHGTFMPLASTIKALIIQTADEAGSADGPDYRFGWGLVNAHAAADLIAQDEVDLYPIQELTLDDGDTTSLFMYSMGEEPVKVTIAWTDPPASVLPASLDPSDPRLVNDLDLRLINVDTGVEYLPYLLDRDNPAAAATTGDNIVDNVEQVDAGVVPAGDYVVRITHKGTLTDGHQDFSIAMSGLGWSDDPRVPPSDLTAEVDLATGEVSLAWTQQGMDDTFDHFEILRDGDQIGSTSQLSYTDQLDDFGRYSYEVRSVWDLGTSNGNPRAESEWFAPVAPVGLAYTVNDPATGDVTLQWMHLRGEERFGDDGSGEMEIHFSSAVAPGIRILRGLPTREGEQLITSLNAWVLEGDGGFGDVELALYAAGEGGLPGEEIYRSDAFTPDAEGWVKVPVSGGEGIAITGGDEYFVGLIWEQPGTTSLALDNSSENGHEGWFSADGNAWLSLDDFTGGVFAGNPLLRFEIGSEEVVDQAGLVQYTVYRDGASLGSTTERSFDVTVDGSDLIEYTVAAEYLQGEAVSAPLLVDPNVVGVEEQGELPLAWEIGAAWPNPFNPSVSVPVTLAESGRVHVTVYDVLGRRVAAFATPERGAGRHTVSWNGAAQASGVYFLRIQAGPENAVRKVVLMR